jgi:hypothetical protein
MEFRVLGPPFLDPGSSPGWIYWALCSSCQLFSSFAGGVMRDDNSMENHIKPHLLILKSR